MGFCHFLFSRSQVSVKALEDFGNWGVSRGVSSLRES